MVSGWWLGGVAGVESGRNASVGATGPAELVDSPAEGVGRVGDAAVAGGDCLVDSPAGGAAGASGGKEGDAGESVPGASRTVAGGMVSCCAGGRAGAVAVLVMGRGLIAVCTQVGRSSNTSAIPASVLRAGNSPRRATHLGLAVMLEPLPRGLGSV